MDGLLCELIYNQILKSMWKTSSPNPNYECVLHADSDSEMRQNTFTWDGLE